MPPRGAEPDEVWARGRVERSDGELLIYATNLVVCGIDWQFGGGGKGSDEEHTTCSGGTNPEEGATSRLAQGYAGSQKLRHIVRTTTSHFLFLIIFIILILFSIDIMHLLRIYKKP